MGHRYAKGRVWGIYPKGQQQFFLIHVQPTTVQGSGQSEHFAIVEFPSIGYMELKGETKHQIVRHGHLGQPRLWQFLEENTALLPLHPVKESPVLVVYDFQSCKGDVQGCM